MREWIAGVALLATGLLAQPSQAQLNLTLTDQLSYQTTYGSDISDIWGYVDGSGNEYAIVGVNSGAVSIVDVTDPNNVSEVFSTVVNQSIWYDIKTWNDHAYITTEGGGGMTIIDMSGLPGNTTLPVTTYLYSSDPGAVNSAHNLYIDENGICYIFGADRDNGGTIFLDLNQNPTMPNELGAFETWYAHDGVVQGDTLYASHINDGFFSIVDVSDKTNPVILGTQNTPVDFSHNAWFSDDLNYLYTTDEVSGAWIGAYDVSDPTNIVELDRIQSSPGSGVIPHNAHFINDYIVTSYYRDGVTIHDVSDPTNMIEVGNYDTSPLSGDGFNGCWGVYPWLPSGNVIASDIEGGLFVFSPTYVRGCYLEGNVTEVGTGLDINDVTVEVLGAGISENTDITGDYATGTGVPGTYDVAFSKPGYEPDTTYGVVLTNGQLTIADMQLTALVPFDYTVNVAELGSGVDISGAMVNVSNEDFNYDVLTGANGSITINGVTEGTYNVTVGAWGWTTWCMDNVVIDANNNTLSVTLDEEYYDDFSFDYSWTVTGAAPDGIWERGEPNGTATFGAPAVQTDEDIQGDCNDQAYVTGNATGGGAGSDDVDDAATNLTSPVMDLTGYTAPHVSYYRWFFNGGGQTVAPDDSLIVSVTDGTVTTVLEVVKGGDADASGGWNQKSYALTGTVNDLSNVQIIFHTADYNAGAGHLVEAAIDVFRVYEATNIAESNVSVLNLVGQPNPFNEDLTLSWDATSISGLAQLEIHDVSGRTVYRKAVSLEAGSFQPGINLESGVYLVRLTQNKKLLGHLKVIRR